MSEEIPNTSALTSVADNVSLAGKVAIVTGAARGMGACTVRRFHECGATVVFTDILDDDGKALADELGDRVAFIHHDVADESGWVDLVVETERQHGHIDVLVNNAGILKFNSIVDTPLEELQLLLNVNLIGTFLGMKHVIPAMKRAGGGSIVNLSSTEGLGGTLFCGAYTATKFGVRGITKVAAIENGADKIRVNSVHPGGIDTPMTRAVMGQEGRDYVAKHVHGLKRMGEADEIAKLIVFLASDLSSYCTGAEFVIDGGATANAGF
ncbi:MAG: SDR family oxidoreductase [Frankiaceae bacterium]|nr:SDR family oxidoreductase [Frankiaceae bacterium]MBV9870044.1 SDR family oxidoreductase [Frankiaceae bacterium]